MSKKYFTCYIPVEAELKVGDSLLVNGENELIIEIRMRDTPQYRTKSAWYTSQKIKLLLCSSEVKVGDIIKSLGHDNIWRDYTVIKDGDNMWFILELGHHPSDYWTALKNTKYHFKVIGEVTPDAKWVKEGDEFDENDISRCFYGEVCPGGKVKIKGPCGHFH